MLVAAGLLWAFYRDELLAAWACAAPSRDDSVPSSLGGDDQP
jgi:hypothetical protein